MFWVFPSLRLQSTFDMQTDRRHFNRANWSQCCAGSIGSNTLAGFLKARSIFQSTAANPASYEMPLILNRNTGLKDDFPSTAAELCSSLLTAYETKWTIILHFPLVPKWQLTEQGAEQRVSFRHPFCSWPDLKINKNYLSFPRIACLITLNFLPWEWIHRKTILKSQGICCKLRS